MWQTHDVEFTTLDLKVHVFEQMAKAFENVLGNLISRQTADQGIVSVLDDGPPGPCHGST